MTPSNSQVHWLGRPESLVRPDLRARFTTELEELFSNPAIQHITVHDCFMGYSTELDRKVVLGVEVRSPGRVDSHIVKLGDAEKVMPDLEGWRRCAGQRYVGGRIFVRLDGKRLNHDTRGGIIYEDAYLMFGLDPKTQGPKFLEEAAWWAIKDGAPHPASVERVIRQVFGDLQRWFYHVARPDPRLARAFYVDRLSRGLRMWSPRERKVWDEMSPDPCEPAKVERLMSLRADATWLLGGLDLPDAQAPAVYLDPYDYVCWALENDQIPPTLVGPSHGDLHGHNVLVGVRRGEAEFPVVIDYGDMAETNVLAWDFVKLEMELKTRFLTWLFEKKDAREALLADRKDRPPRAVSSDGPAWSEGRGRAERARRLAFCFAFEARLADAAEEVNSQHRAEATEPPGQEPLFRPNRRVDRALRILLRIRQEAALCLGFAIPGRDAAWREELNFALAVYGLATTKWANYTNDQIECALVSAGVAAARLDMARRTIRDHMPPHRRPHRPGPSYRPILAHAHAALNGRKLTSAIRLIEQAREDFPHATPLQAEHALILAETGDLSQATAQVEPLRALCGVFGDFETLTRIGRAFKDLGDDAWTRQGTPPDADVRDPAWQYYRQALVLYEEAYTISRDHYPGVNAATLALLVGDREKARQFAFEVLESCGRQRLNAPPHALYWLFVTEGEAALVAGLGDRARVYYDQALRLVGTAEIGMVHSSWKQLCRLWHVLDGPTLGPTLEVFRGSALWSILPPGPLGHCGLAEIPEGTHPGVV